MNKRTFRTQDGTAILTRESRWLKIYCETVTSRHSLYHYAEKDGTLYYFKHNGKRYALGQFMSLGSPIMFDDENQKTAHVGYVDSEIWYNPYLLELDPNGEYYCRLYTVHREEE